MGAKYRQAALFPIEIVSPQKARRSGTFVDNMKLPVHRWFRYSAGFSADWVEQILTEAQVGYDRSHENFTVFDPFAGSATTLLAADRLRLTSFGVEAQPFVFRVAQAKLLWATKLSCFEQRATELLTVAETLDATALSYPELIHKCYSVAALNKLDKLRRAWIMTNDDSPASRLNWLVLTAILRPTSSAGTAQWQYILPDKSKKAVVEPLDAFRSQFDLMRVDMELCQHEVGDSKATVLRGDARCFPEVNESSIDYVITSPPYANNYDYADATRFEMSFWGEVDSWGDLQDKVRKYLIRSSSQHASNEKLELAVLLGDPILAPLQPELSTVCLSLAEERFSHGGKKHYHTMIAAYFLDMAKVWRELRRVCREGAKVCFVIGDSAPYGIYVPVDRWLGELALAAGFQSYRFEKLRDRNIKWKNRTHTVPLHEGRLWVE